jgi:hypothetical protein
MEAVLKRSIAVVSTLLILMVMFLTVPALAGTRDDCIAKCKEAGEFIKKRGSMPPSRRSEIKRPVRVE